MKVHKLKSNIIEKLRSSNSITSITQCVTELVLNSLDAKSTSIAIRINFVTFRIQIVDNGDGITKDNLHLVGERYMTNKCNSLEELELQLPSYGFRGEALASIINISRIFKITSRFKSLANTYSLSFIEAIRKDVTSVKVRPCNGTTVTVDDFLYNIPLRKKRVTPELELIHIRRNIECLSIIHPNVSFSLRNDVTGDLIMHSRKCDNVISSFKSVHPKINDEYSLIKVSKNNISIKGLIFKEMTENNNMQYIYVNKRPIKCPKIQSFISTLLQKSKKYSKDECVGNQENKFPIYVLNIKCSHFFVDVFLSSTKTLVEFQNWDIVMSCIEKLILSFLGIEKSTKSKEVHGCAELNSNSGMSQVNGMFKSYGFKRKNNSKDRVLTPAKIQKLCPNVQRNDFTEISPQITCMPNTLDRKKCKKTVITDKKYSQNESNNKNFKPNRTDCDTNKIENESTVLEYTNTKRKNKQTIKHVACNNVKPLPVTIFSKKKNTCKSINFPKNDTPFHYSERCNANSNTPVTEDLSIYKLSDEKSLLPLFTNDENKGKSFIMDMFLKSTQVYNNEEETEHNKRIKSTTVEIESNYFVENNVTTYINRKNKTMSVSVNIKKSIKKRCKMKKPLRTIKSISNKDKVDKKFTECVQSSLHQKHGKGIITCNTFLNETKLAENCTIVFSSLYKSPHLKFLYKSTLNPSCDKEKRIIPERKCNCKCNCRRNIEKIFNFDKLKSDEVNLYKNSVDLMKTFQSHKDIIDFRPSNSITQPRKAYFMGNCIENSFGNCKLNVNNISINKRHVKEKHKTPIRGHFINRSPYFLNEYNRSHLVWNGFNKFCKADTIQHSLNFDSKKNPLYSTSAVTPTSKLFEQRLQSTQINSFRNKECYADVTTKSFKLGKLNENGKLGQSSMTYFKKHMHKKCDVTFSYVLADNRNDVSIDLNSVNANKKNCENKENRVFSSHITKSFPLINTSSHYDTSNKTPKFNLTKGYKGDYIQQENCNKSFNFNHKSHKVVGNLNVPQITQGFGEYSKLFITLSNKQTQDILEKELYMDRELKKMEFDWDNSKLIFCEEKELDEKHNDKEQFKHAEWTKKLNVLGNSFYINRKTGFTTFCTPKEISTNFKLCPRFEFIPKGLSPVFKEIKEVDKSLSQSKKKTLENYIVECHQNELLTVKWQNYIKHKNPKIFFEEMYREKLNLLETKSIPSAVHMKKEYNQLNSSFSFHKMLFDNINVIGQVDKKFIAVFEKTKHLLILFDQHAVDERIRLEELLNGYQNTGIQEDINVLLSYEEISLLKKHEKYLNSLGLHVNFSKNYIKVIKVPLCLHKKFKSNDISKPLNAAVELLVKEITESLKRTGGVTFKNLPKIIMNVLNLEACRGAIKFGDELTNIDCEKLLKKLSTCNLPFQCAHGRPSLVPLLSLNLGNQTIAKNVNLKKLCNVFK